MRYTDEKRLALDRVLELVVLVGDDMARGLAVHGLTVSRAHLLWELRARGPTTQKALADALGVSPRTVTGLVDGLVSTGFITRGPHPSDRRAVLVSFTAHGTEVVEALERGHEEFARTVFAGLSAADLGGFVAGLDHVLVRLRAQVSPPA